MSNQTTIKNFWMILLAGIGLIVIVMMIANAALDVDVAGDSDGTAEITAGALTSSNPPATTPWYERAGRWVIGFVLTAILSGRMILLVGVLLFYGFIISYIAPNAWAKIKSRMRRHAAPAATEVSSKIKPR
ncbi:MAG: hypothetical protein PHX83_17230 [Acidobacteriia bacterium]|nr:hypothetical protein [Terriglobia bacterium]